MSEPRIVYDVFNSADERLVSTDDLGYAVSKAREFQRDADERERLGETTRMTHRVEPRTIVWESP